MKKLCLSLVLTGIFCLTTCKNSTSNKAEVLVEEAPEIPKPLAIGYGLGIGSFNQETLTYAKSVGVDYVEASGMSTYVDGDLNFKMSDKEMRNHLEAAKAAADASGIDIWSIHMPFGKNIDLSVLNKEDRKKVVETHAKLVEFLEVLEPEVILFHPSYYLGLNERDQRKAQLIKSAEELNEKVKNIGAIMVIENMLGPKLLVDENRERPLMRTVDETVEIFNRLSDDIHCAVDMNHIKNPEKLIRAMGDRLKSVHIADGTGEAENHFFPCTGKGLNNWNDILVALDEVGYQGPFMYESRPEDEKQYLECYQNLFQNFTNPQ